MIVKWPNGKKQVIINLGVDKMVEINVKHAQESFNWNKNIVAPNTLFADISDSVIDSFQHKETDFIDFNIQKLLPHKLSEYGPALVAGDVNGDGPMILLLVALFHTAQPYLFNKSMVLSKKINCYRKQVFKQKMGRYGYCIV